MTFKPHRYFHSELVVNSIIDGAVWTELSALKIRIPGGNLTITSSIDMQENNAREIENI